MNFSLPILPFGSRRYEFLIDCYLKVSFFLFASFDRRIRITQNNVVLLFITLFLFIYSVTPIAVGYIDDDVQIAINLLSVVN